MKRPSMQGYILTYYSGVGYEATKHARLLFSVTAEVLVMERPSMQGYILTYCGGVGYGTTKHPRLYSDLL